MSLKMNYSATNLEVKKPGLPPSSVSQLAQSNLLVKAKKKKGDAFNVATLGRGTRNTVKSPAAPTSLSSAF